MTHPLTIALAGSTTRTAQIAQALFENPVFEIPWVLTPPPKKIGRKQILTPNSLDEFAQHHKIQKIYVKNKIDESIKKEINEQKKPDFLLVVDFGYFVPKWLLEWPNLAPINIHPSALPHWRGSSPGQFSLLFGETQSAVSVIIMNEILDQGPIIHQEFFTVHPDWSQDEYYSHSFGLINQVLPKILIDFAQKSLQVQKQPLASPTPIARQLDKRDSFLSWKNLQKILQEKNGESPLFSQETLNILSRELLSRPVLETLLKNTLPQHHPKILHNARRAFSPWPGLWTIISTPKGEKRMKILDCSFIQEKLVLKKVQIEGKNPTGWKEVKAYFDSGL